MGLVQRLNQTKTLPPFLSWSEFYDQFTWKQGEHVTLLGPTGSGKTTLARAILPKRKHVCVLAPKPADDSMSAMVKQDGYKIEREWPFWTLDYRSILWPRIDEMKKLPAQKDTFKRALIDMYHQGGWTIYFDEITYFTEDLGLKPLVKMLLRQARALNVTVVGGTQRPRDIPLLFYDQAAHLFMWRDNDIENIRRYSGLGSANPLTVRATIPQLPWHETLYVNTQTGEMLRTRVEL